MIKIGEVNIIDQVIQNEYRIICLEMMFSDLRKKHPELGLPEADEYLEIQKKATVMMQKKYPSMGIQLIQLKKIVGSGGNGSGKKGEKNGEGGNGGE